MVSPSDHEVARPVPATSSFDKLRMRSIVLPSLAEPT